MYPLALCSVTAVVIILWRFYELHRVKVNAGEFMQNVHEHLTKNEIEVLNHLIDDAATCEDLAEQVLYIQQAGLHPRDVTMLHDLALEPADVFSSTDDDRVYLIQSISRVITRDDKAVTATIRALEITSGIEVT